MSSDAFAALPGALSPGERVRTVGLTGSARAWVLARVAQKLKTPLVCVTPDDDAADVLAGDLGFFFGDDPAKPTRVLRLPADEVLPWDELVPDPAAVADRLGALYQLAHGTKFDALVLSVRALRRRVIPRSEMLKLSLDVRKDDDPGRDELALKLANMGYRNAPLVEDPGTFSVRGDILDVYPALHGTPIRLEFFGDTVESIRSFDPDTQRTVEDVELLRLLPARELYFSPESRKQAQASIRELAEKQDVPTSRVRERLDQVKEGMGAGGLEGLLPGFFENGLSSVFEYLRAWHSSPLVWLDEPNAQDRATGELTQEIERAHADSLRRMELTMPVSAHFLSEEATDEALSSFRVMTGGGLSLDLGGAAPLSFTFGTTKDLREAIRSHHGEEGALAPLEERLKKWRDESLRVVVACGSAGQADRLRRMLSERGIASQLHVARFEKAPKELDTVHLFVGDVSQGFVDVAGALVVLAEEDLFGPRARRRTRRRKSSAEGFAASFQDLKEGDLCVHGDFGVCRYGGLLTMQVNGVAADFLVLEFAGKDKVYLPVSRMRLISKFTGGDPAKVALDKLGTGAFEKRKAYVKEQLLKMAAELLQLYAERKAHPGHAFRPPDRYFHQFEADFEFEETPDQQKAIDDVIADMQKPMPMDRLVCGDVGYGKTEVAMRAIFKAVLDRKQVAMLVPTTLLAHQHFNNFKKRFDGYPVTVDVISSLRKPSEAREVLQKASEGRVDVVIGTHKLLSTHTAFKDLGLLVIDEEQKFGVKQKESLKRLRTTVDTLTLTATPIPRTLNMALSGMRDLSLITTPPADRRSIRTFVNKFDEAQIKEAIHREISRGGQVYFIHNRVHSIGAMEKRLRELVPDVSMVVAHGQMAEGELEKAMLTFVEKRAQLLLATSIVESGIDIASANTMIVDNADEFGLSQLYQLRGRVGRSKERAYAYLLVPHGRAITADAEKRLEVLQAFTELGAGFNIASHDLEIRGAGSLLGKEQSGSIEAVGFDLYAQMLEEAIAEVRGEAPKDVIEPDVNLPLPAYLPELYVPDVHQRLVLYKRFSQAMSADELEDLRAECIDRFGDAPDELDALHETMMLKIELRKLALRQIDGAPGRIVVTLGNDARLDGARLLTLVQKSKGLYRLTPDLKLIVKLDASVKGMEFIPAARKVVRDLWAARSSVLK
ncbi:MAG: transcription-repair coupling factor [Archangium gephyra]|uniref:Transcription-repair-coupling factor n=1 Tax=Archangium gephyra TaxID=48 RepID=A0A2W5TL05_9BACT|nr:MAG: transcription-repair coupling factor [Archangium gephyra]